MLNVAAFSSASNPIFHHLPSTIFRSETVHIGRYRRRCYTNTPASFDVGNGLIDFLHHLLQQPSNGVKQIKQIHSQIILTVANCSPLLAARLVAAYTEFGLLGDARKVFEKFSSLDGRGFKGNMLLWNSMLRGNVTQGEYEEALKLYCKMRNLGFNPDGFGFPLILRACKNASIGEISRSRLCATVHGHVVHMGFQQHVHVCNELLGLYGKIGRMAIARIIFDKMSAKTLISWNTMVSGFSNNFDCGNAYLIFAKMESEECRPNSVTWTSLLSSFYKCGRYSEVLRFYKTMRVESIEVTAEALAVAVSSCSDMNTFVTGESVHGFIVRGGFCNYSFVVNSLICMYGRNGCKRETEILFSSLEYKSIVSWNTLISSYAESGFCDEALAVFSQLEKLHGGNAMMRPDVISWSSVIGGFAAMGRFEESLELFRRMQIVEVAFNHVTIAGVLTACSGLSALGVGKEIHAHVIRVLIDKNIFIGNGLINMYMKCGSPKDANFVFESLDSKDLFSWNTMIAGYGMLGFGDNALKIFYDMTDIGVKPNEVTFVAILSACSHAGLVTEGRKLFDGMTRYFGIEPKIEHYACLVDLLGRAGLVSDAIQIVKSMPIDPNECVLGALLNSCMLHKNEVIAETTAAQIFNLDSCSTGSYMLLSNLYAANGKWEDSAKVRYSVKTTGLKKSPGYSWIEVYKKVHTFLAGKALDSEMKDIYSVLNNLSLHMEIECHQFKMSSQPQFDPVEEFIYAGW
ncbi:OLC1v1006290C1 [Oldenlandia corymbosa var. corymbosa]|uniref:OLC1v1006290C1 n=1 Tax=Oldenlandia corymbosa var. corymbosa TaxID=529605 RepID=A0AAV1DJA5_OLDCO|nr:OLC1v1006290C1 [Oldenlandia corymbosa var. corymbosa]